MPFLVGMHQEDQQEIRAMCSFETMTNCKVVSRKSEDKALHGGREFERCVCLTHESLFNLPVDSPSANICYNTYHCLNCEHFK